MRKILAGLAVCAAALVPGFALAVPSLASGPVVPHACSLYWASNVNQQASPPYSQTWFHSFSGCPSGYPIQYNRVDCQYPRVSGEFWVDGPVVHAGYSTVSCGAHPNGWIQDGYIWINAGSGWYDHHYYHFYPVI